MLKNYLKIALRNIIKHKFFTFINILGLAVGLACCVLIFLYISFETSYDNYHSDLDRIYRIAVTTETASQKTSSATICAPVAQVLNNNFPQVEKVGSILPVSDGLIKYEDKMFYEGNRMFADNELFEILSIPFLKGNPKTALDRPETAVISKRMADKYFGNNEALGKLLNINRTDYEITGIVENSPANTHFKYDFILSMKTLEGRYPFERWFLSNLYIYTKLKKNADFNEFSNQLSNIAVKHAPEELLELDEQVTYFAQPVNDIHLNSHLRNEKEPGSSQTYLYIFSIIGLLILIIAMINFVNLNTSRSVTRAKEVGIRKVIGANRKKLIFQFLTEALIITVFAAGIALIIANFALPILNTIIGKEIPISGLYTPFNMGVFIFIVLIIGFLSGSYPAFILSSFKPISSLRQTFVKGNRGSLFQKILVTGQFAVSIILIIGTLVVYQQLNFMKNKPLGYDNKKKLIIPVRGRIVAEKSDFIKNEFQKHASITGAALSSEVPGQSTDRWDTKLIGADEKTYRPLNYMYVGFDFLNEYNIQLADGRKFNKASPADINSVFVINKATVKEFGWNSNAEALGKKFQGVGEPGEIIGVIEDFHYSGLQSEIEPLVMRVRPTRFRYLTLSLNTDNYSETISFAKTKWAEIFPNYPFQYSFLDDDFNRQYKYEEMFGNLVGIFTFLGLFIACLGLLGLSVQLINQKTKEIGVRKVLGASAFSIILNLNKSYALRILISSLIACPIAWYVLNQWLQNFAYRIDISLWVFAFAGSIAFIIAAMTISSHAIKAAMTNPVESLKYE